MKDLTQDAWIADRDNARDIFPKRSTSKIENRVISAAERNADPLETERRYQEVLAHNAALRKAASEKSKADARAKARVRRAARKS